MIGNLIYRSLRQHARLTLVTGGVLAPFGQVQDFAALNQAIKA
jgi:hypothetical protein